jgi:tetratricopeptide (TPR) repeat protein
MPPQFRETLEGDMDSGSAVAFRQPGSLPLFAGRFELLEPLSRGGMGEVFLARERTSGEHVALKRLRAELGERQNLVNLFRAEYQVLARIKHPRIIKVYEFGLDAGLPFYTMELLDGSDLRDLSTTPYRLACSYLRDVASSLALLHAQRLLHRDLSPRNVRLGSDGHCKLLDFGTMTPFGIPAEVAGTAPFVPPEAADCGELDQRADLYSLGALAYWLLTGKHAYPAQRMNELPSLWSRPLARPRSWVPDLPESLDTLVMSLLELSPVKRPTSAAEVIEQLNAIGELSPEGGSEVAQGYLSSAPLCGRKHESKRLRALLREALQGQGAAVSVSGAQGIGKTRLLHELGVYGQTRGMSVLRGYGSGEQGGGSLAQQLVRGLQRIAPELVPPSTPPGRPSAAPPASGRAPRRRSSVNVGLLGAEERAKEQGRLHELFTQVASEQPLLIVIDDLDRADEFSVSLVAGLAHQAGALPLLLVASTGTDRAPVAGVALGGFEQCADKLVLGSLDPASLQLLVSGLVGDVPNQARLVDWLVRGACGNPALTIELIQLLVHKGLVSYQNGGWVLPEGEIREPIPRGLAETLAHRLGPLAPHARALAECVALLKRDATPELCMLATDATLGDTLDAFGELVAAGIFVGAREGYAFSQGALREAVQASLSDARRRDIHRRLGHALRNLPDDTVENRVEAGDQLVHTEDELLGADLLAEAAPVMLAEGRSWGLAVAAMERALEVYERHGAPYRKTLPLRQQLVLAGYLFDYRLALRHGDETLRRIGNLGAFARLERWSRWLGPTLALALALVVFVLLQPFSRVTRGTPNLYALLILFGRTAMGLMGVRATSLDIQGTARVAERVASFGGLWFTGMYAADKACKAFALQSHGREAALARSVSTALAALPRRRLGLSDIDRQDLRVGLLLAGGVNECYRIGSQALARADELEAIGTRLALAAAHRVRMTYHVVRGDRERTELYRKLIELQGIQGGTTWQVEWFSVPIEGMANSRYGDVVGARHALSRLEGLAAELPSLSPLRDMVRIAYHGRRGDCETAILLGEDFLKQYPPHSTIGWGNAYADIAGAYNRLGRYQRAREICQAAFAAMEPDDRDYVIMYGTLELEMAIASVGLGDPEGNERMSYWITRLEAAGELSVLVVMHEALVTLAALQGDPAALQNALQKLREAAELTGSPWLVGHAARIAQAHQPRTSAAAGPEPGWEHSSDLATSVQGSGQPREEVSDDAEPSETPAGFDPQTAKSRQRKSSAEAG